MPIEKIATTTDANKCSKLSRTKAACRTDSSAARQQVNFITSFVDGSAVYGSSDEEAQYLRVISGKILLPYYLLNFLLWAYLTKFRYTIFKFILYHYLFNFLLYIRIPNYSSKLSSLDTSLFLLKIPSLSGYLHYYIS